MKIELTFANFYLDAQSLERVVLGGELQVKILKSQFTTQLTMEKDDRADF